jgi:DNA-3-methyladenine glycosylase II
VRVVIGQMLSRAAASTIYARLAAEADRQGLQGTWELDPHTLQRLGLSRGKVRTVKEFSQAHRCCPSEVEAWKHMSAAEIRRRVSSYWGMSDWTAGILSIFYLGHEDVFPQNDGTLKRVGELLHTKQLWCEQRDGPLGGERASPYRSYLALYLWKAIDEGFLSARVSCAK